ncbi:siderophore-interacting protein [Jatrophihabitans fulvus]
MLASVPLTPRMRRVTVRADSMREVEVRPAQDVELHLRETSGRRVKRRYTIRHARPAGGELDLDVVLHGDAPGSAWGANAAAGDEVSFQGPRGKLELRPARHHLLIGDESALPAIASVCEALPDGETAVAVIEIADTDEEQDVRADVRWVHREGADPGTPDLLRDALAEITVPSGTHAYLMGESRAMIGLRADVEALGVAHDDMFVKGYWNVARHGRTTP